MVRRTIFGGLAALIILGGAAIVFSAAWKSLALQFGLIPDKAVFDFPTISDDQLKAQLNFTDTELSNFKSAVEHLVAVDFSADISDSLDLASPNYLAAQAAVRNKTVETYYAEQTAWEAQKDRLAQSKRVEVNLSIAERVSTPGQQTLIYFELVRDRWHPAFVIREQTTEPVLAVLQDDGWRFDILDGIMYRDAFRVAYPELTEHPKFAEALTPPTFE